MITGRGFDTVRMLANEQVPVVGHLGFVPRKSTWVGAVRAVGKTAAEALLLWEQFKRLEDAGAFAVECEVIPAAVMAEINPRTGLVTISLGSGGDADVIFLFTPDICGEAARLPRHARAWGRVAELQSAIREERRNALQSFRAEVEAATFPSLNEKASIPDEELGQFRTILERGY